MTDTPVSAPGCRVLVFDDVEINCLLTASALSGKFRVDTAVGGADAIAAIEREAYDLVLMDLEMPGFSGYEVAAELRTRELVSRPIVVAFSAFSEAAAREKARVAGMNDYIARPIPAQDLCEEIDKLFARNAMASVPRVWYRGVIEEIENRSGPVRTRSFLQSLLAHFEVASLLAREEPIPSHDLRRVAHDLTSTAGMLGFEEVSAICRSLQHHDSDEALATERLSPALGRAIDVLRKEMAYTH